MSFRYIFRAACKNVKPFANEGDILQQPQGYHGAGFGVGHGMVVVAQIVSAGFGHGMQLMVGQSFSKMSARGAAGAVENVVGIFHTVHLESGFEATLVEPAVVSHQRQSLDKRLHFGPHIGKNEGIESVVGTETVHLLAKPAVVIGFGADERIKSVGNLSITNHHHANRAHRRRVRIGRFKVYCCKILHFF